MSEYHHTEQLESSDLHPRLVKTTDFQIISDVFAQLGDATRVRIFWLLCHREECVSGIAALTGMSSPAVSHHLRLLRSAGLIVSRREGKEVYYHASETEVGELLHHMIEHVMHITCGDSAAEKAGGHPDGE